SLLESNRHPYVLFMCQQAIEKALKSLIAKATNEMPPRIHNLTRLSGLVNMDFSEERLNFFREVSSYYIRSRYPEEFAAFGEGVSAEKAKDVYNKSLEIVTWLSWKL
ncbi:MAG: HEPN domain-containing protein, partial [Rectinemataceae bacterium]|nr:HEPN domain-containing protein [Rectinemataceae bacterium]